MRYPPLFITATGTGVGKTYTTCALIDALTRRGVRVAALKPIETGVTHQPEDGLALQGALQATGGHPLWPLETIVPVRYPLAATPAVACGDEAIDWAAIDRAFTHCSEKADMVLIEGAGGAFSPLEGDRPLLDLADRFEAEVLIVAPDRLGMIHDLLTTTEAVRARGHNPTLCVNRFGEADFESCTRPWLERYLPQALILPKQMQNLIDKVLS